MPSFTGCELAKRYGERGAYQEVPGHAHRMFLEPGWESVADRCDEWMSQVGVPA